jgi:hypothetical protein
MSTLTGETETPSAVRAALEGVTDALHLQRVRFQLQLVDQHGGKATAHVLVTFTVGGLLAIPQPVAPAAAATGSSPHTSLVHW